ncbi:MAG: DNA primase [Duodenibacillus sp.]|nr:DNA primase [Duodenibacillus sp.]
MIPQGFIQELLNRVDIVPVVERAVKLKKTGKNYMGCCPFHHEKTPSFSVNPQKQFFKCFGCGKAGSVIGFVMEHEGLSFPEAVRALAEQNGMTVPEDPQAARRSEQAKTLADLMQMAADFYRASLRDNARCLEYLRGRGITAETSARFCLGYSPEGWQSLQQVFGKQYGSRALEEAEGCGLVIVNDNGRRYDRFRGRLMYPIRNRRGQTIGFGARTLNGDEQPKYLNSPETAIYRKGSEIYGLYEAYDAIRKKDRVIVCEGYMDVIQLSQAGFQEAVAALGTAITGEHVRKLLKAAGTIYFCFDGDSAGQHAMQRALEAALPVVGDSQQILFIVLPPEHDPDSLIKEQGPGAFEAAIAGAKPLSEFFLALYGKGMRLTSAEGKSNFLALVKPLIAGMQARLLQSAIVDRIASSLQFTADETARMLGVKAPERPRPAAPAWEPRRRGRDWRRPRPLPRSPVAPPTREDTLLAMLLNWPQLASEFSGRIEEEFLGDATTSGERILEVWRAAVAGEEPLTEASQVFEALKESPHAGHYDALISREFDFQTEYEDARLSVASILNRMEYERLEQLFSQLAVESPADIEQMRLIYNRKAALKLTGFALVEPGQQPQDP